MKVKTFGLTVIFVLLLASDGSAQLYGWEPDTCSVCFAHVAAFGLGAGPDTWHIGGILGPVYFDFNGNFKSWGPPDEDIIDPFSWFVQQEQKEYMRLGFAVGTGFQIARRLYIFGAADFTWRRFYTPWASSVSSEVWYTADASKFKAGWLSFLQVRITEGMSIGGGYGDIRGPFASVFFGQF